VPQEISDGPQGPGDGPERGRTLMRSAREPGLLAAGAVLLVCAPFLPGLSRIVVLPALLLAPGYALLRLLGQATDRRSVAIAVPASLVLVILASLILDVTGVPLGPRSLGLMLGAATAVFLVGSYGSRMVAALPGRRRETPRPEAARPSADVGERT